MKPGFQVLTTESKIQLRTKKLHYCGALKINPLFLSALVGWIFSQSYVISGDVEASSMAYILLLQIARWQTLT